MRWILHSVLSGVYKYFSCKITLGELTEFKQGWSILEETGNIWANLISHELSILTCFFTGNVKFVLGQRSAVLALCEPGQWNLQEPGCLCNFLLVLRLGACCHIDFFLFVHLNMYTFMCSCLESPMWEKRTIKYVKVMVVVVVTWAAAV